MSANAQNPQVPPVPLATASNHGPRPLPDVFVNQNSYGLTSISGRDTMPKVAERAIATGLIVGDRGIAARAAMVGLREADSADDIMRLTLSAVISGSGLDYSFLEKSNIGTVMKSDAWREWARNDQQGYIRAATSASEPAAGEEGENAGKPEEGGEGSKDKGKGKEEEEDEDETDESSTGNMSHTDESHAAYARLMSTMPKWYRDLEVDIDDFLRVMMLDEYEVAGFCAILVYSFSKQPSPANMKAFTVNRAGMVRNYIVSDDDLEVFKADSKWITLEVLRKAHRAMNSYIPDRALVVGKLAVESNGIPVGSAAVFYNIFRLCACAGLSPLLTCTRFLRQYPQLYPLIPELETEIYAVADAMRRFSDMQNGEARVYAKVMFGNRYVPVNPNDIDQLYGLAKDVLKMTDPTMANLLGGHCPTGIRDRVFTFLGVEASRKDLEQVIGTNTTV